MPEGAFCIILKSGLQGSHSGPYHRRLEVFLVSLLLSVVDKGWARPIGEQVVRVTGWQGAQTLSLSQGSQQCSQGWPRTTDVTKQVSPGLQLHDELVPLAHSSLKAVDHGLRGQELLLESRNLPGGKAKVTFTPGTGGAAPLRSQPSRGSPPLSTTAPRSPLLRG
jgi:hypothetical protein